MISEEDIKKALSDFNTFDRCLPAVCPQPTRSFVQGEFVRVGNLDNCVIAEVLEDGKVYRIINDKMVDGHVQRRMKNRGEEIIPEQETRFEWWHDIKKLFSADNHAAELFADWLPGQVASTSMDSLFFTMSHDGIVCDPRYQRDYVWTGENQEALIQSIFDRVNIGTFVFSRHMGYLYDNSKEVVTYTNLDGDEVTIPRKDDYTSAIIDGQQRMTTLWRFVTDQFKFHGRHFTEHHARDQFEFMNTIITVRKFDEDDVPYKKVLEMFLKVNRGVPQDDAHLDRIKAQLENM